MFLAEVHLATPASLQALHSNNYRKVIQMKHNMIKNPNWQEANQLTVYKHSHGVELRTTMKQIQLVARAVLELRTSRLWVCVDHSTTLPPILLL